MPFAAAKSAVGGDDESAGHDDDEVDEQEDRDGGEIEDDEVETNVSFKPTAAPIFKDPDDNGK